jgi:GNAT superfamily N-acetyltransferase
MADSADATTRQDRLSIRRANRSDIRAIVALLADDVLGAGREHSVAADPGPYGQAFDAISQDPNQLLVVACYGDEVVATMQLTFIPGLSRGGATRGQIEAVRVSSTYRGERIGEALFAWAIERCRERGCSIVQLTSDTQRADAHRFYERLGFVASHVGFKLLV